MMMTRRGRSKGQKEVWSRNQRLISRCGNNIINMNFDLSYSMSLYCPSFVTTVFLF